MLTTSYSNMEAAKISKRCSIAGCYQLRPCDDSVNEPVVHCLLCAHEKIAVRVLQQPAKQLLLLSRELQCFLLQHTS